MKKHLFDRILSLVLAAVMVLGLFPAVSAAPASLRWSESDVDVFWDRTDRLLQDELHGQSAHEPTDMVRVSIVLEDAPTIQAGYATMDIGSNAEAMAYDRNLNKIQKVMEKTISAQALDGKALDVVWNLTLVSNIISANVPYGKIEAIKAIDGVRDVVIERQYETTEAEKVSPNMYTSAGMIGSVPVWAAGMTGAGTRVAIIDTGTDTDHQSFDNGAYLYALEQNAAAKGMDAEDYKESLNLLDTEQIASVLQNLNATERIGAKNASDYYISEKLPFGANYVDKSLNVTHDYDEQGSHGSHVAGIAAANRWIPEGDTFVDARDTVRMSGVAPDAQIITMKIFGAAPGPSDSDYFAAIEDAILLGCDSVNLSLGSGSPGFARNYLFADLLDFMATTDTVVVVSAGNSGHWAEYTAPAHLYADGVSFHTAGSPGTYTNSLTVASVENDGTVGKYIKVGDHMIIYAETTEYRNAPMSSLDRSDDGKGTAYEYIYIDGMGYPEDYKGIDLTGKVVFCQRGEISFTDKANIAANLGAAAIVICNNEPGVIGMDLSDYIFDAPCVSILQSDGAAVRAASTKQTAGGLTYYTGTVTVAGEMGVTEYGSEYYTMSAFSSWGVPGSLELKPEITAPGGMIWSVNGVDPSRDAYEMMSGTSMAAPQVTGMAALVAEYIKSEGLDAQTDLSVRHLAQSLLMSTAVPMREAASAGGYYSILNQGAGLARVDLATTAGSYILVEGMADGKVKAELGEDSARKGEYSFSFTINNLDGEAMTYALSADVFTQDQFRDEYGNLLLDTKTCTLGADTGFAVNGISLEGTATDFACDLNGDGVTSAADADFLLEYLVGNETELFADGDVNADGKVDSYDAHVLLTRLSGGHSVDVPANGSATVEVTLKLTEATKELLNTNYPTGAYIEAYVYAEPIHDPEGVEGVTHSIPVLGYYGSWTEPSMYDVGSYMEYASGTETRTPYLNGNQSNVITIDYGDGSTYAFGGNPYTAEDAYLPQRNAFNNRSGAVLNDLRYTQIRNAGNAMLTISNADNGEVYLTEELGESEGAYFHINLGTWQNTQHRLSLNQDFADIPEGTRLNISLATAPEYYCSYDVDQNGKSVLTTDWEALAEGAYLTIPVTIDNTAPEIKEVKLNEDNTLSVTAQDNEYIAAVSLMNAEGTNVITSAPANQTQRGIEMTTELDLKYVFGDKFLVAVSDYAENTVIYELELELELDGERPYFTAIDRSNLNADNSTNYVGLDSNGTHVNLAPAPGRMPARAAEYVEGAVFEITHDNKLYVGYDQDLYNMRFLRDLDPNGEHQIVGFNDIAYNRADGALYGLFYSKKNEQRMPYLGIIDLYSGELEVLGQMPIDAINLAIDDEGNFYSTIFANSEIPDINLHKYTSDVIDTGRTIPVGELKGELEGDLVFFGTSAINSMAWDHKADKLYWGCTDGSFNRTALLQVDPSSGAVTLLHEYYFMTCGLYIAYEPEQDLFSPVDEVDTVLMPARESTLVGNTVQLSAQIAPWNASDWSVTWSSSDEGIATVDENGLVTGVRAGTAVITATSRLDSGKSASCTVTVATLDRDLKGLVRDGENRIHWASFNTDAPADYESLRAIAPDLPVRSTMMAGDTLYASTLDTATGLSDLYTVDPKTFEMTRVGGTLASCYLDMAYAPHNPGYGLGVCGKSIALIDLYSGEETGFMTWGMELTSDLVGITYYDSQYSEDFGGYMDFFLILDSDGNVYLVPFLIDQYGIDYLYGPYECYLQSIGAPADGSYFQDFYYDGAYIYWTVFNGDDKVELMVWDVENTGRIYSLGCFRAGVSLVGGLYTNGKIAGTKALTGEKLTDLETAERSGIAKGCLNAVKPMSNGEVAADGTVAVAITIPAEGTNGMMTVTYDAAKLELVSAAGRTDAFAWKQTDEGEVKIAFADRTSLTAESVAAFLSFKALDEGETAVTVSYGQWNEGGHLPADEEITLTLHHLCPSEQFVDVSVDQWFHEAVDYVVSSGYMNGMDNTHFGPGLTMNRAQFVTVLYRMEGEPEANNTGIFTDVPADQFYTDAAYWALETGITTGATATTFKPGGQLTRTELVTFMYRYAAYKGANITTGDLSAYTDAGQIPGFAVDAWSWAVKNGIITGMTAQTLAPMALTNRAQAAAIFQRFDNAILIAG